MNKVLAYELRVVRLVAVVAGAVVLLSGIGTYPPKAISAAVAHSEVRSRVVKVVPTQTWADTGFLGLSESPVPAVALTLSNEDHLCGRLQTILIRTPISWATSFPTSLTVEPTAKAGPYGGAMR